ncbi:hypothetical protein BDZ90DRAFT_232023 [Jaminaea rosea]|uniref:Uncharacterized protein n=1 Tax=Jaminaea rosea TaxID=1569628 RepID=A0A316UWU2_9BASI|nr:hypothetical protein BDZ90DRAFT_232023 [Jaminaea rosea]PWN27595.1 hypothetical protein BDZ90DRAFT_232023 [Jaminaea rosea]
MALSGVESGRLKRSAWCEYAGLGVLLLLCFVSSSSSSKHARPVYIQQSQPSPPAASPRR